MPLTTVYFPKFQSAPGELPYRKAYIDPSDIEYFIKLGAVTTPAQLSGGSENGMQQEQERQEQEGQRQRIEEITSEPQGDPDKGFGEPGSLEFHEKCIWELTDQKDIDKYLKKLTGKALPKRYSSLPYSKQKAIAAIREFLDDDDDKN